MNRIVPKCKLKDVCAKLDISIKLISQKNGGTNRFENFGENKEETYSIGLIDEHYFLVEKQT